MDIVNSFEIEDEILYYYDLNKVISKNLKLKKLPIVLKILLESNLRKVNNNEEFENIINIFSNRLNHKIGFYPSQVILQEFTGIPALVDLASMRESIKDQGGDVSKINPQILVDLVIDQSLNTTNIGSIDNSINNTNKVHLSYKQGYEFVKWAQNTFSNFRVVPPGSGICHQVNLEYLSTILHVEKIEDKYFLYPETILGTDSNTTLINSLGVLGWGVDSIEAQSAMLGLPMFLNLPKVVGINLHGELKEGINSTDLVLTLTKKLKEHDVTDKLIEFYGEGLRYLTLEDRSTVSNMAPEYGAKCSFFAIDNQTISYFNKTRDNENYGKLIKSYLQKQHLFYDDNEILDYDEVIDLDLSTLEPTIVGPKRAHDSVDIKTLKDIVITKESKDLKDADIVIAAITSCTSSSNPYLLIHAALVAKKAHEFGLHISEHTKVSLAPGSLVVKEYLEKLGLLKYLEILGFHIVGYGCTTCYANQGTLDENLEEQIKTDNLNVCSVSSGNRNFEAKMNPLVKSNYLMSPSLVIIYSLIGTMKFDLFEDVIGVIDDKDIYLRDLWPTNKEVGEYMQKLDYTLYKEIYKDIFKGDKFWQDLKVEKSDTYNWDINSTYIQASKLFEDKDTEKTDIKNAQILALFADKITTEYISPLGQISLYSPAAKYLESKGVKSFEYSTFASRRGDAEVMTRGTFDDNRIQNAMVTKEGAYTMDYETNEIVSIYDKAMKFKKQNIPLVIFAGEEYGKGDSRDWAAKGTKLLGIKAIIAKSFSEPHRKNLIEFGVLPLQFIDDDIKSLKLKGSESITIEFDELKVESKVLATIHKKDLDIKIELRCRIDTLTELNFYKSGGVLSYLLNEMIK
ncbi:MAG: aconitate hydratase AcnA [Halarcobacter sp.]